MNAARPRIVELLRKQLELAIQHFCTRFVGFVNGRVSFAEHLDEHPSVHRSHNKLMGYLLCYLDRFNVPKNMTKADVASADGWKNVTRFWTLSLPLGVCCQSEGFKWPSPPMVLNLPVQFLDIVQSLGYRLDLLILDQFFFKVHHSSPHTLKTVLLNETSHIKVGSKI